MLYRKVTMESILKSKLKSFTQDSIIQSSKMFSKDKTKQQLDSQNVRLERTHCSSNKVSKLDNWESYKMDILQINFEDERLRKMEEHARKKAEREAEFERERREEEERLRNLRRNGNRLNEDFYERGEEDGDQNGGSEIKQELIDFGGKETKVMSLKEIEEMKLQKIEEDLRTEEEKRIEEEEKIQKEIEEKETEKLLEIETKIKQLESSISDLDWELERIEIEKMKKKTKHVMKRMSLDNIHILKH